MAFPTDPLDVHAKLLLGGAWVDVTSAPVLARDRIRITRGAPNEASRVDSARCSLSIRNPSGTYSPRNPMSPHYGKLGRNTPLRVQVGSPVTPVVRSVSSATAQASSITVTKPAGTVAGDTLLVFHSTDQHPRGMTPPASVGPWELVKREWLDPASVAAAMSTNVWMRVATADEPTGYTFGQGANADGVIVMVAIAGAGEPLNANPYFEVDSSAWSGSGATIARSTAQAHEGAASLLITPDGVSGSGGATATRVAVTAGQIYLASMWMYSPGGWSDLSIAVDWYTAVSGGSFISTSFGPTVVVPAGVWTYTAALVTAPATAAGAALRARHAGTPTAGDIWYVDEVKLQAPGLEVTPTSVLAASLQEESPGTSFDTPSLLPISDRDLELRWACGNSTPGVTWTPPAGYTELADLQSTDFATGCLAARALTSDAATGVQTFTASQSAMENGAGFTILVSSANVRFHGEISSLPQRWRTPDVWVPVTAQGILRRLGQSKSPLYSPVRRAYQAAGVVAYWPLEDGSDAQQFASAISGHPAGQVVGSTVTPSAVDTLPGSAPLPMFGQGDPWQGIECTIPTLTFTDRWVVEWFHFVTQEPTAVNRLLVEIRTTGTAATWQLGLRTPAPGQYEVQARDSGGTLLGSITRDVSAEPGWYGEWIHCRLEVAQSGGNVSWTWTRGPVRTHQHPVNISGFNSFSGSIGRPTSVLLVAAEAVDTVAFGHFGVFPGGDRDHWGADYGYITERAGDRFLRLCDEEGITARVVGDPGDTEPMGKQRLARLLDLLHDCETTDQGVLFETRDDLGLTLRTRMSRYNQPARLALTYTAGEVADMDEDEDDWPIRNDITVTRRGGSSARAVQDTGPLSIKEPPEGAGRGYEAEVIVDAERDDQLSNMATWLRHVGTWDEPRYPGIRVDLAKLHLNGKAALAAAAASLDMGDRFTIADPPVWLPRGNVDQHVEGYGETLDAVLWEQVYNGSPAGPWLVGSYAGASDTDPYLARYGVEGSVLHFSAGAGDTTLRVRPGDRRWSTDSADFTPPMRLRMGGEEFDVSAVSGPLFVAAGAAGHGDNTSRTPAMPAGVQGQDLLLILAAIRSTSAEPVAPAGYSDTFSALGNLRLFAKIASGSVGQPTTDTDPTVTFTGGVAGDTTSAQMAAFRHVRNSLHRASSALLNGSAQDIATPGLTVEEDVCLLLLVAWKQDDWTGVAVPAGWTEIGEPSATVGNDQGIYWAYQLQSDRQSIQPGSLVVSGGAAAISRSRVIAYRGFQVMTVSQRSVNGAVKAHPSGITEVRLAREARYAW